MNERELEDAPDFQRILHRDGFSPDLPATLSPGKQRTTAGLRLMMYMLGGLRTGSLDVILPNGVSRQFRGGEFGPHGVLLIRNASLVRKVLFGGEVGFGEAYLDGDWDSPDLARLLAVLNLNEDHMKGPYEKNVIGRFWGWLQHRLRANSRSGSRENIEYHYDLGNDFYRLWLDETMAYSSGMLLRDGNPATDPVAHPTEALYAAQQNKYRLMLERLDLRAEHHLLEIGSGWGGFAIYAAQRTGCRITSITLSSEQLAEAQRRADAAGLGDRVKFELRDYRDVNEQYDRIVSVEMYEAVGESYWPGYFATISKALKPGGRAAIQGITIKPQLFEQYRRKRDFIQKYIFPGGMLCPPGKFQDLAYDAGLLAEDVRFHAEDYADTLALWHRNVQAQRDAILQQFDARFLRMWRYYLAYCECGFRTGSIDLMQVTLRKPEPATFPAT